MIFSHRWASGGVPLFGKMSMPNFISALSFFWNHEKHFPRKGSGWEREVTSLAHQWPITPSGLRVKLKGRNFNYFFNKIAENCDSLMACQFDNKRRVLDSCCLVVGYLFMREISSALNSRSLLRSVVGVVVLCLLWGKSFKQLRL